MTQQIIVAPEAEAQIRRIDSWWRQNRIAAPHLFTEELAASFATIAIAPDVGHRYLHPDVPGVRRVLLRATRHHVYYVTGADAIVVVAVWGSIKGAGPDLLGSR